MTNQVIPAQAVEAAAKEREEFARADGYRRGYRDGLANRKQVTAEPREWEPGDPVE